MATDTPRVVYLGNRNAVDNLEDPETGERVRTPMPGKLRTTVALPAEWTLMQCAQEITGGNGVWAKHSDDPAPAWVASTDPQLAQLLATNYGCELRDVETGEEAG